MPAIEQTAATSPIGRDTQRVDGPLKVTGKAQYTSDFHFPGLLYGVPVEATIAKGKVVKLDTGAAEKMLSIFGEASFLRVAPRPGAVAFAPRFCEKEIPRRNFKA